MKEINSESPLQSLKTDLIMYNDLIREVSEEMMENEVTQRPIFLAHQHESALGEALITREEMNTEWDIHVTSFEEFVEKGVINKDKEDFFLSNFKDPLKFMCILVMVPEGANFVYFPYK